ncbi:Phosphoribosyl-AMP cyclohydrolase [Liberibacter crescens BT-1]|uniref:Phosphoribosyl-AMP cyclohydrolase n=1 Tax=Liberibacter crescens (strain BT-1) TaxID=1215343 RepID=L0EU33_LIBCB|nr:phosphoribosyl-AMP cyclohydrolase [Liberibacter crescens]AGA65034.1 Phosphoribosyl-AMP cyclohydrolase [Liberibacter crescens BT-1]AMC13037.1 phosphoribosyl-AMP cyclohydrolase [Liberibacter crescens]
MSHFLSSDKEALQDEDTFKPRFDENGLITAVITDVKDGDLLMVAHMNEQALSLTLETGIAHYFSRSRNRIWKKGEVSGHFQRVEEILIDCDQDCVQLKVYLPKWQAACHTGRRSCFYSIVYLDGHKIKKRVFDSVRLFDPKIVYGNNQ